MLPFFLPEYDPPSLISVQEIRWNFSEQDLPLSLVYFLSAPRRQEMPGKAAKGGILFKTTRMKLDLCQLLFNEI